MLRPQGYVTVTDDRMVERDSITCGHCNQIVIVKPGSAATTYIIQTLHIDPITRHPTIVNQEEPGAFCRNCMRAICLTCHDAGVCTPLMRRIEQMEARGRMLAAVGL
jgi:hypothetical protein